MDKKIKHRECKFVLKIPDTIPIEDDIHIVKEIVTYEDGTKEPKLNIIKNFKRAFWITKPIYQNYKQKKESEPLSRLDEFTSTQKDLYKNIASRLGQRYIGAKSLRDVSKSPYVYGIDVDTKAIIKNAYQKKYPNVFTNFTLAVLDIEVNVDTNDLVIISIAKDTEVYIAILDKIIPNKRHIEEQLKYLYDEHIPKTEYNKNIVPKFELFPNELQMIISVFRKLHKWKTDFIAIWNIEYDIPFIVNKLKEYNVDPKLIFSHPEIPKDLKYFEYKQGNKVKKTDSGVHKLMSPEEQWHIVKTPSYSYWIDAMCVHRYVRVGGKSVAGGYSLNNILEKELGKEYKKLKFEDENTSLLSGIDWHRYMLAKRPLEYIIYNVWDVLSMLELDNKTKDLATSMPALSEICSFDIFNSGPKKIIDLLHYFYLRNGRVLGCRDATSKEDDNILPLSGWIVIQESAYIKDSDMQYIEEYKNSNNIKSNVADLDAVSSYPSDILAANVSKDTTHKEVISIGNVEFEDFLKQNINLFFGKVNDVEYCSTMMNFPTLDDLNLEYKKRNI